MSAFPLHAAAAAGDLATLQSILDGQPELLDWRNDEGRTALHDAIENGCSPAVEWLVEQGAEIDICAAAILGQVGRVMEWLRHDPALVNDRATGLSPLGWAAFGNQVQSAIALIAAGARMDDMELFCAAMVGHLQVGRCLLERGARAQEVSPKNGATPLHAAASLRYTDRADGFARMLLDFGADPQARDQAGRTPLDLAKQLAEQQASSEADAQGDCPRDYASMIQVLERPTRLVRILRNGTTAEPVVLTDFGRSVIEQSCRNYPVGMSEPDWPCYFQVLGDREVGGGGFKAPPSEGVVEIAYFTTPGEEGRGFATEMARKLMNRAWSIDASLTIAAETLCEENASVRLLRRLGFTQIDTRIDPDEGCPVWHWQLGPEHRVRLGA